MQAPRKGRLRQELWQAREVSGTFLRGDIPLEWCSTLSTHRCEVRTSSDRQHAVKWWGSGGRSSCKGTVEADPELSPKPILNAVITGHLSPALSRVQVSFFPNQQQLHFTEYGNHFQGMNFMMWNFSSFIFYLNWALHYFWSHSTSML